MRDVYIKRKEKKTSKLDANKEIYICINVMRKIYCVNSSVLVIQIFIINH